MRNLLTLLMFAAACGGAGAPTETPRPSSETGGYRAEQPAVDTWQRLGTPVEIAPAQAVVEVGGTGGKIGALLIKGVAGEAEIEQIHIEYMDEQSKRVDLSKRFLPGDAQVIELREDRAISKITVILDPDSTGTFEIFGA